MSVDLTTTGIRVTPKLKTWLNENGYKPSKDFSHTAYSLKCAQAMVDGVLDGDTYLSLIDGKSDMSDSPNPEKVYGGSKSRPNVKRPSEMYSNKQYSGKHVKTGLPVYNERGEEVLLPSEKNYAMTGSLIKHLAYKSGLASARPTEHEAELVDELAREHEWAGDLQGEYCKSINPRGNDFVKALLDDAVSGGLEIAPISFDSDIISTPQLSGELFPYVDTKEIARGRRIEGGSIANIAVTSGEGTDNVQMALFNTANLVAAINTTIFSVGVAIEVGKDFMSDAGVDVGRLVETEIGNSMRSWLDTQIALGDGTTEPEGIMVAAGTTAVAWGGATSVANYESLLFSVPKAQRPTGSSSVRFGANETTYQRMKALPIAAGDARRIFGGGFMGTQSHEDYQCLGRPYSISTSMANTQAFFGDLKKYRMYRRVGMGIEVHTQGDYLGRRNLALIIARARFGGRVMLPSSFGIVTTAPA